MDALPSNAALTLFGTVSIKDEIGFSKALDFLSSTCGGVGDVCGCFFMCVCGVNLDEVSGAAVYADVRQLQTDDLTGLGDDEGGTGQLRLRRREGEVAFSGQHVQASCKTTHTHTHTHTLL